MHKTIENSLGNIQRFISRFPQGLIVSMGSLLGKFIYNLAVRHRRIVRRNLQLVHPDWSHDEIRRFSKAFFRNFGITIVEILQMCCLAKEDILHRVRVKGKKNLETAMNSPGGVIIISAHMGNWEMICIYLSCVFPKPAVVVSRKIKSGIFNVAVHWLRARFGNILVDRRGAFSKMAQALREGTPVGMLIDQGAKSSEGVEVKFLGRYTNATPAAAMLAIRCNRPIFPAFCIREDDGTLTLIAEAPFYLKRTNNLREDLKINTQKLTEVLENAVNKYPEQWFWAHKRWKRHYPYFYREEIDRRKKIKNRKRK